MIDQVRVLSQEIWEIVGLYILKRILSTYKKSNLFTLKEHKLLQGFL